MKKTAAQKRTERLARYLEFARQSGRHYIHESSPPDSDSSIPRWGVSPSSSPPETRRILITGTGRCGTDFISRVFTANNYDVPHETVGSFGSSSHWFISDSDWYPVLPFTSGFKAHIGHRKSDFVFEKTVHLVRHPIPTIKSITNIFRQTDIDFLIQNGIIPERINLRSKKRWFRGMVVYYYVNHHLLTLYPVPDLIIHIEKINTEINNLSDLLCIPPLIIPASKPTNTSVNILGFRLSRDEITFNTLKAVDYNLASKIFFLSKKLGYSL